MNIKVSIFIDFFMVNFLITFKPQTRFDTNNILIYTISHITVKYLNHVIALK